MGLLDGVIVTADQLDDPLVDGLLASSLPTVLIGHRRADGNASYVDVDNVAAADMVTTHLIGLGRTRVGHITGRRRTVAGEDRIAGYTKAMARAGLATESLVVEGDFREPSGRAGAHRRRERDAILPNDATAVGALQTSGRGCRCRTTWRSGARRPYPPAQLDSRHDGPPGSRPRVEAARRRRPAQDRGGGPRRAFAHGAGRSELDWRRNGR
jgi:hypothetical protein